MVLNRKINDFLSSYTIMLGNLTEETGGNFCDCL